MKKIIITGLTLLVLASCSENKNTQENPVNMEKTISQNTEQKIYVDVRTPEEWAE